jgi:tetratricopeptide (TPR) repeat protein
VLRSALTAGLVAVLFTAAPARADDRDYWTDVVDPHGDEIRMISDKAAALEGQATNLALYDGDPSGAQRTRLLDDAFGMLRYARRLAPHNPAVLLALGRVADDGGRVAEAQDALEAYLREVDTAMPDAHLRLGKLYLRLGQHDRAIRHLRQVRFDTAGGAGQIYLAAALTGAGRADEATEALAWVERSTSGQPSINDSALVWLALAIAYDRDEQLSAAYHVVEEMQTALSSEYTRQLQQSIATIDFVPAIDRRYYQAFLYETGGYLTEARAEWLNYAAAGEQAPFRGRALAHVAEIDRLLAAALVERAKAHAAARAHPPPPPPIQRPSP